MQRPEKQWNKQGKHTAVTIIFILSFLFASCLLHAGDVQASSSPYPLTISVVQQNTVFSSTTSKTSYISYQSNVTKGDLLVLLVSERGSSGNAIVSVSDSLSNVWSVSESIGNMSYIYSATSATSGEDTVKIKFTTIPTMSAILMVLEAKGVSTTITPVGSTGENTSSTSTVRTYKIPTNSLTVAVTAEYDGVPAPTNTTAGFVEIVNSTYHGEYSTTVSGSSNVPIPLNETGQFFECAESYISS